MKDQFGIVIPTYTLLAHLPVVVIETMDAHNKFCINLKKPDCVVELWIEKGTRLFQFIRLQPNQMVINHDEAAPRRCHNLGCMMTLHEGTAVKGEIDILKLIAV